MSLGAALGAALLLGSVAVVAPPAVAQTATQSFDIAAQPLGSALIRFSETTGIQLFYDASLARGLQSPGVSGTLAPSDALGRLLAGSGLTFRFTNATTVTLQREQAAAPQGCPGNDSTCRGACLVLAA